MSRVKFKLVTIGNWFEPLTQHLKFYYDISSVHSLICKQGKREPDASTTVKTILSQTYLLGLLRETFVP